MSELVEIYLIIQKENKLKSKFKKNIPLAILKVEGTRDFYKPIYFSNKIKPLGKVKSFIPSPNSEYSILDVCILFYPKFFEKFPSFKKVKRLFSKKTFVDFDFEKIPKEWLDLRDESIREFKKLNIIGSRIDCIIADDLEGMIQNMDVLLWMKNKQF